MSIKISPLRIERYIVRIENILLILLALSVCISEPLSRNIVRIIFVAFAVKIFVNRNKNTTTEFLKRHKLFLITISAFAWWMIISSLYGGHLVSDSDSYVYWFFFSHNMILFLPMIMIIRRQKFSDKLLIALGISLLIDDAFIFEQIATGVVNPITFLNDSPLQNLILYVILLPTFLVLSFNESNSRKKIFFAATFLVSLIAFWLLYAQVAFKEFENLGVGGFLQPQQTLWAASFEMLKNNPIMGVGLGNFNEELNKILPAAQNLHVHHAFNTYLQFWAETGIFGLILFCGIFGKILIWARRRCGNVYGKILFFSTLSLMLYAFTDFIFESYSAMRAYWFLLGVCIASLQR